MSGALDRFAVHLVGDVVDTARGLQEPLVVRHMRTNPQLRTRLKFGLQELIAALQAILSEEAEEAEESRHESSEAAAG